MLISCGIQWFAQAAMYFSHAHLYLKGTSWLTSALELMTRLSSTETRRSAASVFAIGILPDPAGTMRSFFRADYALCMNPALGSHLEQDTRVRVLFSGRSGLRLYALR